MVCVACQEGYPGCAVCAVPVVKGGLRLSDGRVLCRQHAPQAVLNAGQARASLASAEQAILAALGAGLRLHHPVDDVRVVDRPGLLRLVGRRMAAGQEVLGLFHLGIRGVERRYTVYFVSGLPQERLQTVAAHEYAHAWQSEQNGRYSTCSDRLREGFAEWVAFRVNRHLGRQSELDHLLAEKTGPYAEGLRRLLEVERRSGASAVLRLASSGTDL